MARPPKGPGTAALRSCWHHAEIEVSRLEEWMEAHKWQFVTRFRRHAFGWRSATPILRIKEAVSEIKTVRRKDPVLAAEGAVILLEKLSPALEQVDSSSGAIGSAVNRAVDALVPIIAKANVDRPARQAWLERLWQAVEDDGIPYIECLADNWGELCATPELAISWSDRFLPLVELVWRPENEGFGYSKAIPACLSALFAAGRHEALLALLEQAPFKWWHDRRWGVKALAAMGRKAEAVRYAEESRGLNDPGWQIAQACEAILLSSGLSDDAYRRYALEANVGSTNLATFRAIARKYPHKPPEEILRDLIKSTPGTEGKWFAAAKDAGHLDLAIELAQRSPTDPRTLTRAARDYGQAQPEFAVAAGLAALSWISVGHGYEITATDVLDAYTALMSAAAGSVTKEQELKARMRQILSDPGPGNEFLRGVLGPRLSD